MKNKKGLKKYAKELKKLIKDPYKPKSRGNIKTGKVKRKK